MNNQVGAVVAQVMETKENVTVTPLPSMIRVDAVGRMDFVYDEISEALGEEAGYFDAAEFEENMSTHYGRMIHEDDRTIMFANPEDAAEYIGFDLRQLTSTETVADKTHPTQPIPTLRRRPCTRRTARSTSSSTATCTTGTPAPQNWVAGPGAVRQGLDRVLPRLPGPGPAGDALDARALPEYSEDDLMKDVFEDGYVDVAIFQPTYLKEWYTEGFNTTERNGALAEKHPGKFIVNTRFDPRDGDAGLKELEENVARWGSQGRQALHRGVERRLARLEAEATRRPTGTWRRRQELGIKNVHVHKGPTIWPLDKDAFDVVRRRPRGDRLPGAQLHRRARRACPGSRTSASWRRRSPTSTRDCPWSSAA